MVHGKVLDLTKADAPSRCRCPTIVRGSFNRACMLFCFFFCSMAIIYSTVITAEDMLALLATLAKAIVAIVSSIALRPGVPATPPPIV